MNSHAAIVIASVVAVVSGCDRAVPSGAGNRANGETEATSAPATIIENQFGMRFVLVPFETALGKQSQGFYLHESEVTLEQFRQFRVASGQPVDPYELKPVDQPLQAKDFDSWTEARDFAEQLTAIDPRYVYRLPTEAEWEFACRGGHEDKPKASKRCLSDDGYWLVKQREPNGYGLHDMLGVLGEYCSDYYYSERHVEGFAEGGEARVVRGMRQSTMPTGCFLYEMDYRFPIGPAGDGEPKMIIGVRLVLEPKPTTLRAANAPGEQS